MTWRYPREGTYIYKIVYTHPLTHADTQLCTITHAHMYAWYAYTHSQTQTHTRPSIGAKMSPHVQLYSLWAGWLMFIT